MSVESIRQTMQSTAMLGSDGLARISDHVAESTPRGGASEQNTASNSSPYMSSIANKPNLSVSVDSPSWSPNGGGLAPWQQPYSELSRFPSASYKMRPPRQKDWPPEGTSKYMTPLPSPLDTRSRSLSDAASDVSTDGGGSVSVSGNGRAPARTKTMQFFETMDAAFSPPPPPRLSSANYDHSRRDLYASTSSLPDVGTASLPIEPLKSVPISESPPQTARPSSSTSDTPSITSTSASTSTSNSTSATPVYQPLSSLPSAFRSDPIVRQPPASAGQAAYTHARTRSGSNGPFVLGRQTVVHDSPLPSPTESQTSKWTREPPSRLPTMPPEGKNAGVASKPVSAVSSSSVLSSNVSADDAVQSGITPAQEAEPGHILNDRYEVLRSLGLGAFSKVVLAKRIDSRSANATPSTSAPNSAFSSPKKQQLQSLGHRKTPSTSSISSRNHIPTATRGLGFSNIQEADVAADSPLQRPDPIGLEYQQGFGERMSRPTQPLVALKLISRSHIKKNDRMRISIVREVEVLKHIRHPSLVHLTSSFETPFHTCLVLEYSPGGELFDLLANHHEEMSEALVRRIFGELADVLGWMHSIGLVHRDIKLENILLTSRPFTSSSANSPFPSPASLPDIPTPFVKLTDFGLSRFIDPSSPYLETRCGSEEYAAPELIMGKRYDGRQTDAWALGVVLYALTTGFLPFVEDGTVGAHDTPSKHGVSPSAKGSAKSRRNYLLKIAKGEYSWPASSPSGTEESRQRQDSIRLVNEGVKSLVGGLLTRDPKKRVRTEDVWDFEWMQGPGAPEKRSLKDGGLEGVSVAAFGQDDQAMVRAEVPDN